MPSLLSLSSFVRPCPSVFVLDRLEVVIPFAAAGPGLKAGRAASLHISEVSDGAAQGEAPPLSDSPARAPPVGERRCCDIETL